MLPILKGLGHPDTICDNIMNKISINLSKEYLKRVGYILHHNIDKALLSAGEVENRFNGGIVKKPMLLVIGDRATFFVGEERIPVEEIAINTAKNWFKENLRFVDPEEHIKYQIELKQGSAALVDIFKRRRDVLGANDTSAAVGYAPMTETEKIVLKVENFLNSKEFKKEFPESGEDVKVMGLRAGNNLNLTIAMAFVDRFIDSEETYFKRKEEILGRIKEFVKANGNFNEVNLYMNTLDKKGRGIAGMYLTVLGTCADGADCGQVGRGNRINGIHSLNRPVSNEAAAGKQPLSHPGKVYNVLSFQLANEIFNEVTGIKEVYVWLLSQIGKSIDEPHLIAVQSILERNIPLNSIKNQIEEVINKKLDNMDKFIEKLVNGELPIC